MTMVPLGGLVGSAAGAPLSQTQGSEAERAQKSTLAQAHQNETANKAERAAGIGETEQDQESTERDADGRRLWEQPAEGNPQDEDSSAEGSSQPQVRQSKDASGQSGNHLDLTG